jgi:hypothetical protein
MQLPSMVGPIVVRGTVETSPVTVLISGQTNNATRLEERVVMDQPIKQTVNLFGPQIYTISCVSPSRTCDLVISDSAGIILAVLPNCDNKTKFKMIDVSAYGWPQDSSDGTSCYVDILYKVPLRRLTQDSDCFPAGDDYDNAWYYATMWQNFLTVQNKAADATSNMNQMLVALNSVKDATEQQLMEKLQFGRNKYMDGVRNSSSVDDLHHGNGGQFSGWPYGGGSWDTF